MGNSDSQTSLGNRVKGHTIKLIDGAVIVAALGVGTLTWQLLGPNTSYDKYMAKNVWCAPQEKSQSQPQKKRDISGYSDSRKLDNLFAGMANGDALKLGGLEIKAIDSRPKTIYQIATNESETLIGLSCPGYIKVDVTHNGQPVPGGLSIEIVYDAKFIGTGGFQVIGAAGRVLEGWPNFTLKDVLSKTSLSSSEISQLISNAKSEKRGADYQAKLQEEETRTSEMIKRYQAKAENDPAYQRTVNQCNADFKLHQEADGGIVSMKYIVKRGDNPIKIEQKFEDCDDNGAFFPKFYSTRITNSDVCTSPQDIRKVNRIIDKYGDTHFQMLDNCGDKSAMKWHKGRLQEIRKIGVGQTVYFPASVLDYSPRIK